MGLQLRTLLFSPRWHSSANIGLLLVRIAFGGAFTYHGLIGILEGPTRWSGLGESAQLLGYAYSTPVLGVTVYAFNAIGGICLILGYCSRGVTLLLGIEMMLVACYYISSGASTDLTLYAIKDIAVFAMLLLTGPGVHSLDQYADDDDDRGAFSNPRTQFVKQRPRWLGRVVRREE